MSRAALAAVAAGLGLVAAAAGAGADITVDPAFPTTGKPAVVRVAGEAGPVAGARVSVLYRPGSEVSRTDSLGVTGSDGALSWTPVEAGVATISAGVPDSTGAIVAQSRNLSVRFRGLPASGLFILIAAGVILYGGVILGFRMLGSPPPALPPDT